MDLLEQNKLLLEKVAQLEAEVSELQDKLKKYTAPARSKTYYETHKEEIIQKTKEHKERTDYYANISPEKKKEYARTAYLNRKEKARQTAIQED